MSEPTAANTLAAMMSHWKGAEPPPPADGALVCLAAGDAVGDDEQQPADDRDGADDAGEGEEGAGGPAPRSEMREARPAASRAVAQVELLLVHDVAQVWVLDRRW